MTLTLKQESQLHEVKRLNKHLISSQLASRLSRGEKADGVLLHCHLVIFVYRQCQDKNTFYFVLPDWCTADELEFRNLV